MANAPPSWMRVVSGACDLRGIKRERIKYHRQIVTSFTPPSFNGGRCFRIAHKHIRKTPLHNNQRLIAPPVPNFAITAMQISVSFHSSFLTLLYNFFIFHNNWDIAPPRPYFADTVSHVSPRGRYRASCPWLSNTRTSGGWPWFSALSVHTTFSDTPITAPPDH